MGSLFGKIFLSFWLTAILLGAVFMLASRSFDSPRLERAQSRLAAHAETAANLYAEQGLEGLRHWLSSIQHKHPPIIIIDDHGRLPFMQPVSPRLKRLLERNRPQPGIQPLFPGRYLVSAQINHDKPGLLLATTVDLGRLHGMPIWLRVAMALLISALVSLGLASLLTRPIRRLRLAAQSMADGDLTIRVGGKGRDEVAQLGRDFDIMAERLDDMLQSHRRLLSDVSHELRSPLARLRVALELLERSEDRPRAVARIEKEADELEKLVTNLLSLARLESGQAALERRPLQLLTLIKAIVNDAEFEAEAKQRRVIFETTCDGELEGDAVLLRAAIENVIRNAVHHTPQGSEVAVTLHGDSDKAVIEVCDHGEGVPEGELTRIFDAFTRIDTSRERGSGGYGLGLSITGQVVAAHDGRVVARNRSEGGLCVTITLPCRITQRN